MGRGSATIPGHFPVGEPEKPKEVIAVKFAGTWAALSTYAEGDVVAEGGSSYVSLENGNKGHKPSESPANWAVLAEKGAAGAPGAPGAEGKIKVGKPTAYSAYESGKEETEATAVNITLLVYIKNLAKKANVALELDGVTVNFVFNGSTVGIQQVPIDFMVKPGAKWKATGSIEGFEKFEVSRTAVE